MTAKVPRPGQIAGDSVGGIWNQTEATPYDDPQRQGDQEAARLERDEPGLDTLPPPDPPPDWEQRRRSGDAACMARVNPMEAFPISNVVRFFGQLCLQRVMNMDIVGLLRRHPVCPVASRPSVSVRNTAHQGSHERLCKFDPASGKRVQKKGPEEVFRDRPHGFARSGHAVCPMQDSGQDIGHAVFPQEKMEKEEREKSNHPQSKERHDGGAMLRNPSATSREIDGCVCSAVRTSGNTTRARKGS
ncbi:hypothetical protein LY76DRAFT_412888 [Colletotrichum caudatum]|nr:hypothetical protein LY76DRAFT_412888 [Colletotrichum caudatum]